MVGTRMYVGGLSNGVRERDIDRFFKGFSGVGDIVMKNGFAFVEFEDHREAEDAIYELNGKELLGGRVTVEKAKGTPRNSRWPRGGGGMGDGGMRSGGGGGSGGWGRPQFQRRMPQQGSRFGQPSRTKYRLSVTNLSSRVSWQDLKDFMRQAGEVTYADAHKNRKNEGVIEFASHSDMRNALSKLDGKDLQGRRIRLYEEDSQGGMGRRRSRSRSRSRSPVSRSKSRSASRSRSRSRSRSTSRPRYQSRDRNPRSKSKSASRSRSRSPPPRRSMSRSRSRSRSLQKRSLSPSRNERNTPDRD